MSKYFRLLSGILCLGFAVSCQSVQSRDDSNPAPSEPVKPTASSENGSAENTASEQVAENASAEQAREEPGEAEAQKVKKGLPPGYTLKELKETIRKLEAERREAQKYEERRYKTKQRVLDEVAENLFLPDKYGQTIHISPQDEPLALPPGPMEELVKKKVSMQLTDAGVQEMIMALSNIDGLNIIADQALQAKRKLTVSVQGVPLKELLDRKSTRLNSSHYS